MARPFVASSTLRVLQDTICNPIELPSVGVPIDLVRTLKALGDETRLQLLGQIARCSEPVCVCDLVEAAPVNQPTVSHHLKVLREAGILTVERRGTWAYYGIAADAAPVVQAALASLTYSLG